jgi:chemotaxis response regulator CheB
MSNEATIHGQTQLQSEEHLIPAQHSLGSPDEVLEARSFPIVGIGASAGGLEAFRLLLGDLPADTGMAFVLIQHLDPGQDRPDCHRSRLQPVSRYDAQTPDQAPDGAPF